MKQKAVTAEYIEGILAGRRWLRAHGSGNGEAHISNLNETMKKFSPSSPIGQLLRGERDFWKHQLKGRQSQKLAAQMRPQERPEQ